MEEARGVVPDVPEGMEIAWRFKELTPYGATGDPRKGTKEKGEKMFRVFMDHVVRFIEEMEKRGWKYGEKSRV